MTAFRRRIAGLAGLLLIVGIVAGLPAVLLAVGANPFPDHIPTLATVRDALTAPDDGTLAVGLIKIVGWVSWLFLAGAIVLETISRLRGVRAPRLPGLRVPQAAARSLVGTAMLLFVAVPAAGIAQAAPASAIPAVQAAAQPAVDPTVADRPVAAAHNSAPADKPAPGTPGIVEHTVKRGETLWSIAADMLGDGRRYREIIQLNKDLLGGKADFIRPGWTLRVPAAAQADPGTVVVKPSDTLWSIAADHLGDPSRYPEIVAASRSITQPGGGHLTDPDVIGVGWTLKIPGPTTSPKPSTTSPSTQRSHTPPTPQGQEQAPPAHDRQPAAPAEAAPPPTAPSRAAPAPTIAADEHVHDDSGSGWLVRTSFGVGALAAAGVIGLLAARRRTQQRRRRPGQRAPMPTGPTADTEQELHATADPLSVETVDRALRALAQHCATTGMPLPSVRAARLTATQFDLYLAEPAELPRPWTGTTDTTVWTLHVDDTDPAPGVDVSHVPAPYPALVTIGHDEEDGHVLLDLEHLGALGVVGDPAATREILAALAVELATSAWADDLQVTVVGAFPDLEDILRTGRIRYVPSVGRVLDDLLQRAELDRRALAETGSPDLRTARVSGVAPDAWPPEIVLIAGQITGRQRNQLAQLVDDLPRVAVAAVTSGAAVGEWSLTAAEAEDLAVLSPIGLRLRPQRLPDEQYGHLLDTLSLADVEELDGHPLPEPTLADVEAVTPVDEPPDHTAADESPPGQSSRDPAADAHAEEDSDGDPDSAAPSLVGVDLAGDAPTRDEHADADELVEPAAQATTTDLPGVVPSPAGPPASDLVGVHNIPSPALVEVEAEAGLVEGPAEAETGPPEQQPMAAPRVLVLGPVELLNARGKVESTRRARLLEYAA